MTTQYTPSNEETFNDRYDALTEKQQHVAEFLSVVHAPFQVFKVLDLPHPLFCLTQWNIQKIMRDLVLNRFLQSDEPNQFYVDPRFVDALTARSLREGRFETHAKVVLDHVSDAFKPRTWVRHYWLSPHEFLRDLRIHALLDDLDKVEQMMLNRDAHADLEIPVGSEFLPIFGEYGQEGLYERLQDRMFLRWVAPQLLGRRLLPLLQVPGLCARYRRAIAAEPLLGEGSMDQLAAPLLWHSLMRGESTDPWCGRPEGSDHPRVVPWRAWTASHALLEGRLDDALRLFRDALEARGKPGRKRSTGFGDRFDELHALALLLEGGPESIQQADLLLSPRNPASPGSLPLQAMLRFRKTGRFDPLDPGPLEIERIMTLDLVVLRLTVGLAGVPLPPALLPRIRAFLEAARLSGHAWLTAELADTLATLAPSGSAERRALADESRALHERIGTRPLSRLVSRQENWRQVLEAMRLVALKSPQVKPAATPRAVEERLGWFLVRDDQPWRPPLSLEPVVQKRNKTGGWSAGKALSFKKLAMEWHQMTFLTDPDRELARLIRKVDARNQARSFELDIGKAWPHLIGHPLVFLPSAPDVPVRVQEARPELQVRPGPDGGRILRLIPALPEGRFPSPGEWLLNEESTFELRLYHMTPELLQLYRIVGREDLCVPEAGRQELEAVVEALAAVVPLHTDAPRARATEVAPDTRLRIVLATWNEGLRLMMRVQPLGDDGPAFVPGEGREHVNATVNGNPVRTTRDLEAELAAADRVWEECPALGEWDFFSEDLFIRDPQVCLEALEQLAALGEDVQLRWPEGRRLSVSRRLDVHDLRVSVRKSGQWFELDGELAIDGDLVISLRRLLEAHREAQGRFVPLGEGRFLALSGRFLKQLALLEACSLEEKKKGLRLPALSAHALAEMFDEVELLDVEDDWHRQRSTFEACAGVDAPVPEGLQVQLREYQVDGFRWMMRLAAWGAGCALADDMGLGKTVQALAVLAARAKDGPQLVVAPLSVCGNWLDECGRFAPRLRARSYHGPNRDHLLEALRPGDVIVTSYGLMQSDAEVFSKHRWATAVLDEAQAIKNTSALRTQAAYQLQADFRVITTGTPVENHLGELWSLFHFLNPGLLLTKQAFVERFQGPIERDRDEAAHRNLRKLIQPFILRRTKAQVLPELPSRTELSRSVVLSDEERNLYEALRQDAVSRLEALGNSPSRHLEVLALITRLRLAACHPRLALADSPIPSSKLRTFLELVAELRENGHRALVFSQFVKHLELVRAALDEAGVPYQYLDGSTLLEARRECVKAFQAGEGDLFLISLKAGGFGLNLTAADYVIHLDPWWNPAVEDQASDRAHRIGQTKPVTIYRLVSEGTIEEKIVNLHQTKRELAERLLDGTDLSGQLGADDLLELIRSGD